MVIRRISRAVRLHKLDRALDRAESYAQWQEIAAEHDQLSGAEEWRAGDDTELLHSGELRRSLDTLRKMRAEGETWALSKYLQEVLFRHQGELIQPEIYQIAKLGTKHVVTELLDEIEACFHYLIELDTPEVDDTYRLEQTKRIGRVYGRPALMLSGGALLGLFHFGVIKALFDENLLPRTISGSSMGAIMAGWACVHSDEELRGLFADLSQINCQALTRLPLTRGAGPAHHHGSTQVARLPEDGDGRPHARRSHEALGSRAQYHSVALARTANAASDQLPLGT
jgi:TAG lipase/steryl ester hydrolase/phospholipase A2/LPA acyltransferase